MKNDSVLKKMVEIYTYACMNITLSVLLVCCRRIKRITLKNETKHPRDLVKIRCSVKIEELMLETQVISQSGL